MSHVPPGWPAVVPRLSVDDPSAMVEFLRHVFGASGEYSENRPAEMRIGESLLMVGGSLDRLPTTSFIYVYVADVDESYEEALRLGSRSIEKPKEMPYGDRRAMVKDRWGNHWQIATHRKFSAQ